ncbi:MAG: DUF2182 domain-containing protein [Gemmatimonadota bacterium]|nr:DUF2182 domain-containing protein [Gemmatimonadota bacterium]
MSYSSALAMWMAMTAVMMAPIAVPWLRALRRQAADRNTPSFVFPFAAGYALAWTGFSVVAAAFQLSLAALEVPVPFGLDAPLHSATALILAGAFQFTPFKTVCLSRCRSPAGYLLARWRSGATGHLRMGLGHGLDCVGCCWALMALALVVGMIDLVWMGLLMAVMVAETTLPFGARLTRPVGAGLVAAGLIFCILYIT